MDFFCQLHLHSQMSTLDGMASAEEIVLRAKELGQPAVALTNHGVMNDFWDFIKAGRKHGVKAIVGNEVYITEDISIKEKGTRHYHLVLLAKNTQGLKNLLKLTTISHLKGFYNRPRIDYKLLEQYKDGLICLSACLAGVSQRQIAEGDYLGAKKTIKRFKKIFGNDFYLEIQPNEHTMQKKVNQAYASWYKDLGVGIVATQDVHYLRKDDYLTHRVLTKIGDFDSDVYKHNYWSEGEEVIKQLMEFTGVPEAVAREAVETTVKIAEQVEGYEIDTSIKLPKFPVPAPFKTEEEYLKQLCREGWTRRGLNKLSKQEQKVYVDRILYEFDVIINKGFSGYFLIVQDFIKWARDNGIVVGYGRGSAGGSLVSWLLGIVELDPIRYGLLFERFLNPERNSLPDIDVDFADRGAVVRYLKEKYGHDKVCSVVTYGTFGAKGVIRDVVRVCGYPYSLGDAIAKSIPDRPSITLEEAYNESEEFRKYMKQYEHSIWKYAKQIEGRVRHFSQHACAYIIADRPLDEVIPLMEDKYGEPMSAVDMGVCEELGLVKFDLLGVKTLSVINKTVDLINAEGA